MPGRLLTFLTDFGTSDAYVAAVKGVALSINPALTIVDITHDVAPQDVRSAAFLLGAAAPYFPRGTVHLAVVDPGVGTERHPLLVLTPEAAYVGPDNGIFSSVLALHSAPGNDPPASEAPLPPGVRAFHLTNPRYWRQPVSRTFHARDIFGPVAAHLTLGAKPEELGEPVESIRRLVLPMVHREEHGLSGHVVHVDRFGNLVTNIPEEDIVGRLRAVSITGWTIVGLSETYASGGDDLMALVGSYGTVEIALRNGSAAAALGVDVGERVVVSTGCVAGSGSGP